MAKMVGEIMSSSLFFQLLFCAISLAVYMVAFASNLSPSMNLLMMVLGVSVTTAATSVYCYLSENITNSLEDAGDIFYGFPWYRLPAKQHILFQLPIRRAQKNFRLTGLGIVECSLSVLLQVRFFSCLIFFLLFFY